MKLEHPQTDEEILKGSIKEPWMFGILVDRYQGPFLRKAFYLLRSPESAEDAVQDTFLKIYKNAGKFTHRERARFSSWAYKILINTCYSYSSRRVADASRVAALEFSDLDALGAREPTLAADHSSFVNSVLARLPANLSRLLALYFFEDKSYEEIANTEKLSLSAVKSGLHRARKQFKNIAIKMI